MKNSLIVMIMVAVIAGFSVTANAADKYVQSTGNSVFTIDREAGTITRQIRSSIQGTPVQSETLSCKYGYIISINGESMSTIDLLAATGDLGLKRIEWARKDCQQYTVEPRF